MLKTTTYRERSRIFLAQAFEELAANDIPQASEKAWGATAQMLKAVAEKRGWQHKGHGHLFTAMRRLRRETGELELKLLFSHANDLHGNFYEDKYLAEDLEDLLPQIERLVNRLEQILESTP